MAVNLLQRVTLTIETVEQSRDGRMVHGSVLFVPKQILLADIGNIAAFCIFSEQVVKWLISRWPNFFGDRFIPFFAVRKDGINIKNNAAKIKDPMPNDLSYAEACMRN